VALYRCQRTFPRTRVAAIGLCVALLGAAEAAGQSASGFRLFARDETFPGIAPLWPDASESDSGVVMAGARNPESASEASIQDNPTSPLAPYPTERHFWTAAAEVLALELVPWVYNRYVADSEFAHISGDTIKSNLETGFTYDRDHFKTNQSSHPFHGSLFFNAARTNGFSFWESGAFAATGSFLWEMFMENEPPAINDLVNTTLGGMTRGESLYRLSNMLLDNTASGSSRLWRELGGLVLNPIGGFNRLIRGEMWKDFETPPDRFPTRFYAALDGFYRHRSGSGAEGTDQNQGGLSLTLRYGDAFDGTHAKPFEFFELETDLVHPADVLVTRSQIRGLIAESVLADAPETGQRLDVFMHFDYFNDTPVVFGSQQFSLDHLYRHCLTADTDLRTEVGMTAMPMAALQVDYPDASLPTVGRSFDYGPGGGAQTSIRIRRRDVDLGTVAYNVLWQHTSNGISRNSRVQTLSVEGRAPIFGHLALGAGWAWAERLTTYDAFATVNKTGTSWRAFGSWIF